MVALIDREMLGTKVKEVLNYVPAAVFPAIIFPGVFFNDFGSLVEITDPNSGEKFQHSFDLTDCPFKELPDNVDYSENNFELELPISNFLVNNTK